METIMWLLITYVALDVTLTLALLVWLKRARRLTLTDIRNSLMRFLHYDRYDERKSDEWDDHYNYDDEDDGYYNDYNDYNDYNGYYDDQLVYEDEDEDEDSFDDDVFNPRMYKS